MKKTLLAITLGALAFATAANANVYVQGDVGYSRTKADDAKKHGVEPRISLGYVLQDVRVAADYTHYGKAEDGNDSVKTRGAGISAIYDIPLDTDLKPYVGARLAVNRLTARSQDGNRSREVKDTRLGYGAIAGVQYPLARDLKLNAGVEYNRLGEVDNIKVNNYGAKVGLRYDF